MTKRKTILLSIFLLTFNGLSAQKSERSGNDNLLDSMPEFIIRNGPCKNFLVLKIPQKTDELSSMRRLPSSSQKPRTTIHGNISYDFLYRSRLDTPYRMNDFYQHSIRMNLQVLYKGRIPLNISFGTRISNSPFFRNYLDMGIRFDPESYKRRLKEELAQDLILSFPEKRIIDSLQNLLKDQLAKIERMKTGLNSEVTLQKLVEAKERKLFGNKEIQPEDLLEKVHYDIRTGYSFPSPKLNADNSSVEVIMQKVRNIQNEVELMTDSAKQLRNAIEKNKQLLAQKSSELKNKMNNASGTKRIKALLPDSVAGKKSKTYWMLASLKSVGIGRTYLDYSDLTAKDVSITGLQVEYNPAWYAAIAIGKINYRFRDFINHKKRDNGQYLAIGRFGVGDINKKALIFTVFKGLKSDAASFIPDSLQQMIHVLGYAVESRISLSPSTKFEIEFAKSLKPAEQPAEKGIAPLFQFDDFSNTGIRFKGQSEIESSGTLFSGYFKKTGENYQSFSNYFYKSNRTVWLARADQPFFKKRIMATAMVRQNDFINPEAEQTFKSTAVFTTFLLKIKFPKWPFLSVGYYPGVQYFITEDKRLLQNAYNIFNGTISYSYKVGGYNMNSMFSYNSYFNKATDSVFSYYRGKDYFITHSLFMPGWNIRGSYNLHDHPDLRFSTSELAGDIKIGDMINVGGSGQYNKVSDGGSYYGYTAAISVNAKDIGIFRLGYSKSFYPGFDHQLYPIETGTVGMYKNF